MLIRRKIKCKLSEKGIAAFKGRIPYDKKGLIVREDKHSYRIIWEGNKTQSAIHKSLVETIK